MSVLNKISEKARKEISGCLASKPYGEEFSAETNKKVFKRFLPNDYSIFDGNLLTYIISAKLHFLSRTEFKVEKVDFDVVEENGRQYIIFTVIINPKEKMKESERKRPEPRELARIRKSDKCVACLEESPSVHFTECGHICICDDCYDKLNDYGICPLCRIYSEIILETDPSKL